MKKVVSTVAALALAGVMATSAFAATTAELQEVANKYKGTLAGYGVTAQEVDSLVNALDASKVDAARAEKAVRDLEALVNNKTLNAADVQKNLDNAVAELKAALGGQVEIDYGMIDVNADGKVTLPNGVKVTVNGVTADTNPVAFEAEGAAATTTPAAGNNGVIKTTGLNTAGVAAMGLAVVSALGVAAVKAKKGE